MLKLGVGGPTTLVEAGEGHALSLAHPRLRAEAMKTAEGRALSRDVGRMLADGDVGATVVFHSDWSTDLGETDAALRDTDKDEAWESIFDSFSQLRVVDASIEGLSNWPTPNALRVRLVGGLADDRAPASWLRLFTVPTSPIPIPAVGERLLYRFYFQSHVPDGNGYYDSQHTVEQNDEGLSSTTGNFIWGPVYDESFRHMGSMGPGEWDPHLGVDLAHSSHAWPAGHWKPEFPLNKQQTYRMEYAQDRISATEYLLDFRIYDAAGTLLYDRNNIYNKNGSETIDSAPYIWTFNDLNECRQLQLGINGFSPPVGQGTVYPFDWGYYGGVAVALGTSTDQWIGPYAGGI